MIYRVDIATPAYIDAREYFVYVRDKKQAPEAAIRWYGELFDAIKKLGELPKTFPLIPEKHNHRLEIRQLLFHSHRVVFSVDEQAGVVTVLRIYHGARRPLTAKDIG